MNHKGPEYNYRRHKALRNYKDLQSDSSFAVTEVVPVVGEAAGAGVVDVVEEQHSVVPHLPSAAAEAVDLT